MRSDVRNLRRRLAGALAAIAAVLASAPPPAKALVINVDAPGLEASVALAAFQRAAGAWERLFTDPVAVNISLAFLPLDPVVLGETSSVLLEGPYNLIRDAMVADALAEPDDGIVAHLPASDAFTATVLGLDEDTAFGLNGNLSATKANLKALGFDLDADFGARDASIFFNTDFEFDFDRRDGVSAGLTDFESVAAHEIGHVLGFDSVVDTVDLFAAAGLAIDLAPRTLDLFRFAEGDAPTTPQEFTDAARLLVPGFLDFSTFGDLFPAVFSDVDSTYPLSTGFFLGDGRQASHWKDDAYTGMRIGLMDPSLARAESFEITAADVRALDLIGWDFQPTVSEPASGLLVALAILLGLICASCRSEQARSYRDSLKRVSSTRSRRRPSTASASTVCARARSSSGRGARRRIFASG